MSLVPWLGGKSKWAGKIVAVFPPHNCYVEVFAGGGAVFFAKRRSAVEVLNDANGELVNLYRQARFHPEALAAELEMLLHSREVFDELQRWPGQTELQRAARLYFLQVAAFGAKVDGQNFGYSTTEPAKHRVSEVGGRLRELSVRLNGVTVEHLDCLEVIARYDRSDTLFYLDPPYIDTAGYGLEFGEAQHQALSERLGQVAGKWVLSINDGPAARRIYCLPGRHWQEHQVAWTVSRTKDPGRKFAELLVASQPLEAQPGLF